MKHVFNMNHTRHTAELPTDVNWKDTFHSQVVDQQSTIELMAKMAIEKYGLTQE